MLLSAICTSLYENLYINDCKTVYDKTAFLLKKLFLKTISAAENCFSGGYYLKVLYCKSSTNHCGPFLKYPRRDATEPRNLASVVNLETLPV